MLLQYDDNGWDAAPTFPPALASGVSAFRGSADTQWALQALIKAYVTELANKSEQKQEDTTTMGQLLTVLRSPGVGLAAKPSLCRGSDVPRGTALHLRISCRPISDLNVGCLKSAIVLFCPSGRHA